VGNLQFVQFQRLGQSLLRKSLLREHIGRVVRAFLALPWVEQDELLNLPQFFDELFHGKIAPGGFGLAMHILQSRNAQHTVERMDADLAVGPMMPRSPSEPLSVFQAAEDALDLLLAGITGHNLFRCPVHAVGEQHGNQAPAELRADKTAHFLFAQPRSRAYFVWVGWVVGFAELLAIAIVNFLAGVATLSHYSRNPFHATLNGSMTAQNILNPLIFVSGPTAQPTP
jgi:hypothetical protein